MSVKDYVVDTSSMASAPRTIILRGVLSIQEAPTLLVLIVIVT